MAIAVASALESHKRWGLTGHHTHAPQAALPYHARCKDNHHTKISCRAQLDCTTVAISEGRASPLSDVPTIIDSEASALGVGSPKVLLN